MKKSILIIVILSIAALCFAGPLQEMHKRVIAGSTVAAGGGDCPDGTYKFAYNGDHSSGTDYACFDSGNSSKQGTETDPGTNITVSEDYIEFDAENAYMTWAVAGDDGIDDQEGTVYFSVYIVDDGGIGTNSIFESFGTTGSGPYLKMVTLSGQTIAFIDDDTTNNSTYGATLSGDTWYRVGIAWKVGATPSFSISAVTLGSAHSWADDNDTLGANAWTPDDITVGDNLAANGVVDTVRVADIVIVSTFKGTDIWDQQ
jgi:hypothetical protein